MGADLINYSLTQYLPFVDDVLTYRSKQTTRVLAEEQFMKRALIEKIQAGIPRAGSDGTAWSEVPSQWR